MATLRAWLASRRESARQLVDQRGFARAWCASNADEVGLPAVREKLIQGCLPGRGVVLDLGQQAGQRQPVTGQHRLGWIKVRSRLKPALRCPYPARRRGYLQRS